MGVGRRFRHTYGFRNVRLWRVPFTRSMAPPTERLDALVGEGGCLIVVASGRRPMYKWTHASSLASAPTRYIRMGVEHGTSVGAT
jgi:hypothetical protein